MSNFKKWIALMTLSIVLVACGDAGEADTEDSSSNEAEDREETGERQTSTELDDILYKSIEAMEEINSFSANVMMTQDVELPDGDSFTSESDIEMKVIQDPIGVHQLTKMTIPEMGETETEMYMTSDGIFFKDAMEDSWYTYPEEFGEVLTMIENVQMKPEEQLEVLKENADHFKIEEQEDHYLISIKNSDVNLTDFVKDLNRTMNEELAVEMEQMMDMADIKDLAFSIYIEKDTFLQTKMDLDMDFQITEGEEQLNVSVKTSSSFADFNEIDDITVPAEVIENAQDFNELFEELDPEQ